MYLTVTVPGSDSAWQGRRILQSSLLNVHRLGGKAADPAVAREAVATVTPTGPEPDGLKVRTVIAASLSWSGSAPQPLLKEFMSTPMPVSVLMDLGNHEEGSDEINDKMDEGKNVKPHKWSHAMEVMDEIRRNTAAPGTLQARFGIPATEMVLDKFVCAMKENFLLQGHLYVFPHYVAFACDLPGHIRSVVFSITDIDCLKKAKLAMLPNSIEITSQDTTIHLASFLHRGKAYDLIFNLWAVAKSLSSLATHQIPKTAEQGNSVQG